MTVLHNVLIKTKDYFIIELLSLESSTPQVGSGEVKQKKKANLDMAIFVFLDIINTLTRY